MIWFPDPMVGGVLMRRILSIVAFVRDIKTKLKRKNDV